MLAEQLKRTGEGDVHTDVHTLLKMLHLPSWAELWEPSALPQHYWILPAMGFLFIEMIRLNCLVQRLAVLSLCFYPETSRASVNLELVHWLQRNNRFD